MMFTIESILGDKLRANRSTAESQRQRRPQDLYENDGKDAKFVASLVSQRRVGKDLPPPLIPAALASAETTTTKSRAPQPHAAIEPHRPPPSVVVCRKRKSTSDGEDDISGE